MKVLCNLDVISGVVWKEWFYGKAETLADREDVERWWQYN